MEFNQNSKYMICGTSMATGEIIENCHPDKVFADIASEFNISNEEAQQLLEKKFWDENNELILKNKQIIFWIEKR